MVTWLDVIFGLLGLLAGFVVLNGPLIVLLEVFDYQRRSSDVPPPTRVDRCHGWGRD